MNFSRFPSRPLQTNPQARNPGSNVHEFIEGLSKIAQIMYTSIPIIEFLRIAFKYSERFFEFIGSHVLQRLGLVNLKNKPEVLLEAIWKTEPGRKLVTRYLSFAAIGVVLFCLLTTKLEEEEWKEEKKTEILSVEDRPTDAELNNEEYEFGMY